MQSCSNKPKDTITEDKRNKNSSGERELFLRRHRTWPAPTPIEPTS